MKVLVADKFEQSGLDALTASGFEVVSDPSLKEEALTAAIREHRPDVLVVRSTVVTEEMLRDSSLSLVVRAGAGYNTIDVEAASRSGIYVSNCPGKNSIAVAELTFGLILALDRRIPDNVIQFREGKWNKKEFSKARGLYGRRLGVLGLGNIGQEVVHRGKAFGMKVVGWSRWITPEIADDMGVGYRPTIEEVAEDSDVLTIHLALTPETQGIIGEQVLSRLKPGTILVNTSRAKVLDQKALLKYAKERGLRVGLDVFDEEPSTAEGEVNSELMTLPNVYVTHHIGASTDQAQEAVAEETVRIIREFARSGQPPNAVNIRSESPASHLIAVRHRDRVGVIAHVLGELQKASINVQEMENIVLEEAGGAICYISVTSKPSSEVLDRIRYGNENILSLVVREL
ncbi:MAG: hypothetical protein AMXMBFR61_00080 [Fimbriimonadales bacterium]